MPEKLSEITLILFGTTLVILILISLIIISLFISQKRKFHHSNELTDLKNSYQQELLQSKLEIQTQTFESISRELHDNVGTIVSIAMVHLKTLGEVTAPQEEKLAEVNALLNEAMDTLRDISRSIHPEHIQRFGWLQSFHAELEKVKRTRMFTVECVVEGEPFPVEESRQIILFRILQEALNNIIRHSGASIIQTRIIFTGSVLTITVSDNGKGFSTALQPGGSGIRNMKARAAMLPALLTMQSVQGSGSVINISYSRPA